MRRRHFFGGLALCVLCASCGPAEETSSAGGNGGAGGSGGATTSSETGGGGGEPDPRFDPLIAAVEAERKELGAPGVAVAVIEDGKVTFARGFGSKDPNADDPVKATTLFRIGSVTKTLTAVALLGQVAQGKIDLDAPVTDYVPEFHFDEDPTWAPSIRGRHLLMHTAGMVDYLKIDVSAAQKTDPWLETFLTGQYSNLYLMVPPDTFYNYSNSNYYLAGLLAEKAAGKPYRQVVKDHVLAPLGMDRTYFLPEEVLADGDYAIAESTHVGGSGVVLPDTYDNAWARPAVYAFSSVLDMAKLGTFLLDGNEAVLPDALREAMQSPQVSTQEMLDLIHHGYGLEIMSGASLGNKYHEMKVVQHGGDVPGFAANIVLAPELRFGFVALASADAAHFTKSLATAFTTLAPLPPASPPPDLSVDPGKLSAFEGVYQDEHNIGDIIVTKVGNQLHVSLPKAAAAGIPHEKVLVPLAGNTFYLGIQNTYVYATFIADETGEFRYFRTRAFVGIRPEGPPLPPPPPLEGERLSRFVDAIHQAQPTLAERLIHPR